MKYLETSTVELKRELTDDIKKEILAFLNSSGGVIYIGITDDGKATKLKRKELDEIDKKVTNWIREAFYPVPSNCISVAINKDNILEIRILEGSLKPYYLKEKGPKPSGVYIRVGSTTRKATDDEILRMIMKTRGYNFEEDISDEQELTFDILNETFKNNKLSLTNRNKISLGMVSKDGAYTNLALLLSDQSPIVVKLAEYDSKLNFRIKKSFKGSLVKILYDIEEQCDRLNDTYVEISGESFKRIETKSYPGASLREIVLNAFCHCDYFIRSNIKIEFYEDKCKITSPGSIFNASLEDILKGVQTYRNPKLVNVFDKLGLIENYGTGIPRTLEAYKDYPDEPFFEATENFFIVTLPNVIRSKNDRISDRINDRISDLGLEILKSISENPGINAAELVIKLSAFDSAINKDKIYNTIKRQLKNYVERRGANKTGGYYLKNK